MIKYLIEDDYKNVFCFTKNVYCYFLLYFLFKIYTANKQGLLIGCIFCGEREKAINFCITTIHLRNFFAYECVFFFLKKSFGCKLMFCRYMH